ncbi:hypothetical protein N0V84_000404 [Fusarium piperis]|uniref:Ankyrin n=1 Tax=Fusarium piperis TaxID=1435070 RepID=A0A9W8WND1_9HYPO|nr:hypothetical protein N0V84_000404 [Fusarium piperis]
MALTGLGQFAPELIELLVRNAFDANSEHIRQGYETSENIVFFHSSEKEVRQLERFQVWRDLLNLGATCRYLYRIITPLVYRYDIDINHSSSLIISAKIGNTAGVTMALNHGADIHVGDRTTTASWSFGKQIGRKHWKPLNLTDQATALHWAAFNGHIEAMTLLLQHKKADVNHRVRVDTSIAHYRSVACKRRAAKFMEAFALPDKPVQEIAAAVRHQLWGVEDSILYKTIEHGANPLYFALLAGNIEMSKLLIEAGSSMETHLGTDTNALHQACRRGELELVRLVLEHTSPSVEDAIGNTPLHYLPDDAPDRDGIISLLLEKGEDEFAIGLNHEEEEFDYLLHVFRRNRRINTWFYTKLMGEEPDDHLLSRNDWEWAVFWRLETEDMTVEPRILCGGLVDEDEDDDLAEEEDEAHFEEVDAGEWD